MAIQLPKWLLDLPEEERSREHTKFVIRYCALYATQKGDVVYLAEALGYNRRSLFEIVSKGREIPPKLAVAIEELVSREVATREEILFGLFSQTNAA